MVELAVLGYLRFAVSEKKLHEEDVVVADECNLIAVRREQRNLLRTSIGQSFQSVVAYIEDVVYGCIGTAVYGLGFCLNQNLAFVGRHDVVVE